MTKNIHQRIAEVMQEVTYIQKERKNGMKYTIVSHDKVTAKVRPALLNAGVIYYPTRCDHTQNGNRSECSMTVRFANIDEPSDHIDVQTFGYGVDAQDKGPGKAMSYAVKYALLKALGLETGDDADHDDIDHDPAPQHQQKFNAEAFRDHMLKGIAGCDKAAKLNASLAHYAEDLERLKAVDEPKFNQVQKAVNDQRAKFQQPDGEAA